MEKGWQRRLCGSGSKQWIFSGLGAQKAQFYYPSIHLVEVCCFIAWESVWNVIGPSHRKQGSVTLPSASQLLSVVSDGVCSMELPFNDTPESQRSVTNTSWSSLPTHSRELTLVHSSLSQRRPTMKWEGGYFYYLQTPQREENDLLPRKEAPSSVGALRVCERP